ncbi:hypothetical protein BRAO375_4770018 [Bradyrhizobium sp. ORS 375]|nr:hypothetical protein BRAO375_4770018 [Bradyrhizobium sp. ORS 375]
MLAGDYHMLSEMLLYNADEFSERPGKPESERESGDGAVVTPRPA